MKICHCPGDRPFVDAIHSVGMFTSRNVSIMAVKNSRGLSDVTTGLKSNSLRLQAGISHPNYGLSYVKYTGYTGESDGATGYFYRELIKSKLSGTLSIGYSSYRLGEFTGDKVNAFSGMLGLTYRPMPQLSVDAQGQFINNRIYKTDARFLIGVNYWLFKKF